MNTTPQVQLSRREAWELIATAATITESEELFINHERFQVEARGLCKIIQRMYARDVTSEGVCIEMLRDLEQLPGFRSDEFYWPWSVEGMMARISFARQMSQREE